MDVTEILQIFWRMIVLALYGVNPTALPIVQTPITVINQAKPDPAFNWTAFAAIVALISLLMILLYNIFNERRKLLISERDRRISLLADMLRKSGVFLNDWYELAEVWEHIRPDEELDGDPFTSAMYTKLGDLIADGYAYGPLIVSEKFQLLGTYLDDVLTGSYQRALKADTTGIYDKKTEVQTRMKNELQAIAEEKADLTSHLFRISPTNSFQAIGRKERILEKRIYNGSVREMQVRAKAQREIQRNLENL